MIAHYRTEVKEVPGTADTFRWCHEHGIKVATDTGFHSDNTRERVAYLDAINQRYARLINRSGSEFD